MVLLSHMLLAATGKHSASPGEAVPQLVVSRLVDTGEATPLVKQIAKLPDATTPVIASSDSFCLSDHLLLGLLGAGFSFSSFLTAGLRLSVDSGV